MISRDNALELVDWIIKEGAKLTDWEILFIKSIQKKSLLAPLSRKQEAIINKIYEKYAHGGQKMYPERI